MPFPDDPSLDPFNRDSPILKERLANRPLSEPQRHRLPSTVKQYLRDSRWRLLKPEHYALYRHDGRAVYLRQKGKTYEEDSL